MKKHIGTKIIMAKRMTAEEASRTLQRPIDTSNADEQGNGYLVRYPDGYISWSPKAQFEAAYRKADRLTFGLAIEALKKGCKLARKGWNGKNMWILMQSPDEHSKMTLPYLYIEYPVGHPAYPNGSRVPWFPSQTDMLMEDWMVVE
ncbi:DUF2829 domain-containing protein [Phosphitispora fastidiosa]|uniref:DUF2829 domain-containing protein n=1 Tax=Phosphitispora fastidiosa TaxID=2837202 RepID=UPI001E4343E1|nr:DUF2829 domain-containing protein [Phosphitispora fastidiosa]MBU7006312.1 hypothetical protein [Phosphitispora fastidiosa]